jgi:hypothetical protein
MTRTNWLDIRLWWRVLREIRPEDWGLRPASGCSLPRSRTNSGGPMRTTIWCALPILTGLGIAYLLERLDPDRRMTR